MFRCFLPTLTTRACLIFNLPVITHAMSEEEGDDLKDRLGKSKSRVYVMREDAVQHIAGSGFATGSFGHYSA
jgi:hypothetical protein